MSSSLSHPRVLILRTAGTNCDCETEYAFSKVGADAERVHINRIMRDKKLLRSFHILAIPGGFSYGDDIASGKILANELRFGLIEELTRFVEEGKLILGICNGFQVLAKAALLPGLNGVEQTATLTFNDSNKFEDRWVHLRAESAKSVFVEEGQDCYLPVAHGEGKFVVKDQAVLDDLERSGQIVFKYTSPTGEYAGYPWNPNGSVANIAAICDPSGRILGMMPHPERHVEPTQHPQWTRNGLQEEGDGAAIFRNAVSYVRKNLL